MFHSEARSNPNFSSKLKCSYNYDSVVGRHHHHQQQQQHGTVSSRLTDCCDVNRDRTCNKEETPKSKRYSTQSYLSGNIRSKNYCRVKESSQYDEQKVVSRRQARISIRQQKLNKSLLLASVRWKEGARERIKQVVVTFIQLILILHSIQTITNYHNSRQTTNYALASSVAESSPDRWLRQPLELDGLGDQTPLDLVKRRRSHRHRRGHHEGGHQAYKKQEERAHKHGRRELSLSGNYYDPQVADRPAVLTQKGVVRGVTQKLFTGKFVDAFLGVPFAQPPLGQYRFRHPQPTLAWQGELDASRLPKTCYQVNDTFFGSSFRGTNVWNANTPLSEDCLYLNIWTPFGIANTAPDGGGGGKYRSASSSSDSSTKELGNKKNKRPVLVWIFGGGFYSGTSSLAVYEGGVLASEEDIVVVSMNYRVSSLGFLYFGRPDAPGNAGLFDQLLALQWIQDNIGQFGGDPDRVTIFGESAGAVSVAYHLLSPLSRNLFSQAILQSGAATCPWGHMEPREIMQNGLQLASLLHCPSNPNELDRVLDCLLKMDPMALVSQDVGRSHSVINFPFVPVIDGSFLLEPPEESLAKWNFKQARILLGNNHDEGNAWIVYLPEFSQCPSQGSPTANNHAPEPKQQAPASSSETNLDYQDALDNQQDNQQVTPPAIDGYDSMVERSQPMLAGTEYQKPFLVEGAANLELHQSNKFQQQQQQLKAAGEHSNGSSNGSSSSNNNNNSYHPNRACKPTDLPTLTREDFLRVLRQDLNPLAEHPIGKEAIAFEYTNWNNPKDSVSNYDALDKLVGDYYFTCPVHDFGHQYALAGNPVYMYYFKQRSSVSPWPKWMGVLHGDEISYIFGEPLNQQLFNYTQKEIELSRRMMRYWANFARYGNPTKIGDNGSQMMADRWPEYADRRSYYELHADHVRVGRGPRAKQCAFWSHYLPRLIDRFDHNQCPANNLNTNERRPPIYSTDPSIFSSQENSFRRHSSTKSNNLLANIPSSMLVSLSILTGLFIIGLLVYAKRTGQLDLGLSNNNRSSNNDEEGTQSSEHRQAFSSLNN